MNFYRIIISGSKPVRYGYYRVCQGGEVQKWQPLSKVWRPSVLYTSEEKLMQAGAVSTTSDEVWYSKS